MRATTASPQIVNAAAIGAFCGVVVGAWFGTWRAVGILVAVQLGVAPGVDRYLQATQDSQSSYLIVPALVILAGCTIAGTLLLGLLACLVRAIKAGSGLN
jgi:hypothetical protein